MKKLLLKTILLSGAFLILQSTTCYEPYWGWYSDYKPVLMTRVELENSVHFLSARDLCEPGKIYIKGDTLFINERYKGIHVYDNSNPEAPAKIGFISIPGCIDMAVKQNILYADNAVDLIAVKLSPDLNQLSVSSRTRKIFPELTPPDSRELDYRYRPENRPANTVIVAWEKIINN